MPLRSPSVLVAPAGHAVAGRKTAREQDLDDAGVLLLEDGHCLRHQVFAICKRAGAHELGDFRATSLNTLVRMVASGTGVTLLPAMALPAASLLVSALLERRLIVAAHRQQMSRVGLTLA